MLPKELELDIVTPEKRIVSMSVDEVVIPGTEGSMGILPGHAPLLTALDVGELMYRSGTTKKYVAIAQGFAEVLPMRRTSLSSSKCCRSRKGRASLASAGNEGTRPPVREATGTAGARRPSLPPSQVRMKTDREV